MPPANSLGHVYDGISTRCRFCQKRLPWLPHEICPVREAAATDARKKLPPSPSAKRPERPILIKPEVFIEHSFGLCQVNLVSCAGQKQRLTRLITERSHRMICAGCFVHICQRSHVSFMYPKGLEPKFESAKAR